MKDSKTVCVLCRQRKVKCDRNRPSCGFCIDAGATCQYVVTQKKRGLRAGYVSELERRLGKLEQEVTELKSQRVQEGVTPRSIAEQSISLSPYNEQHHNFSNTPPVSHRSWTVAAETPDIDSLPEATVTEICLAWFETHHPWFPILHKISLLHAVQGHTGLLAESPLRNVVKAILAVMIPHWCFSSPMTNEQRQKLSTSFRTQVVMEGMANLSLHSLQAILIVTILDYGAGKQSEFWNLVALCKRMGTQLGLRDLVANQCDNFNKLSTIPPRMLPVPSSLIDQEERIRAYWMAEVLDSISSLGAGWNLSLSRPENAAWLPCSEDVWCFPESATAVSSFGDPDGSSGFSLYVDLVTRELYQVHNFLQQSFDARSAVERLRWQGQCIAVDELLIKWRNSAPDTAIRERRPVVRESTTVLINVTFNSAIIALYQRLALPPPGLGRSLGPWYHAIQRCLDSCDEMATTIRSIGDTDLESYSPHLIICIFMAARFFLVHAKILAVEVPRNLDLLIYGLKVCGQRWYFARRLERVLRQAIAEEKTSINLTSLPAQFYDLQYSSLDIDQALCEWVDSLEPVSTLGTIGDGGPGT